MNGDTAIFRKVRLVALAAAVVFAVSYFRSGEVEAPVVVTETVITEPVPVEIIIPTQPLPELIPEIVAEPVPVPEVKSEPLPKIVASEPVEVVSMTVSTPKIKPKAHLKKKKTTKKKVVKAKKKLKKKQHKEMSANDIFMENIQRSMGNW